LEALKETGQMSCLIKGGLKGVRAGPRQTQSFLLSIIDSVRHNLCRNYYIVNKQYSKQIITLLTKNLTINTPKLKHCDSEILFAHGSFLSLKDDKSIANLSHRTLLHLWEYDLVQNREWVVDHLGSN
jgi:hypothetical protein